MENPPMRIALVTPVYDDWASLEQLLKSIDEQPGLEWVEIEIIVVNDGSRVTSNIRFGENMFNHISHVQVVNLICNLGHQRAIAVGLVLARDLEGIAGVIVMDCDGEDRPDDIPRLVAAALVKSGQIICARRIRRYESPSFKVFYFFYKVIFRLLAQTKMDFGNFCFIPYSALKAVVYSPSLWNHLAATLVRSQLPLERLDTERGRRYAGQSSMNLSTLVVHALSAISVYADIVLVRLLIGMLGLAAFTAVGIAAVVMIRFFSDLAIPGWASNVVGALSIVVLQSLISAVISAFILLSGRSTKPVIPAIDAPQFIASKENYKIRVRKQVVAL
jgi:glycosyltransferase involved in cell wall biosynthesis